MSKWTQIRDIARETLQLDEITEQMKENATKELLNTVLPSVKEAVEELSNKLKAQADKEDNRWCKVRDALIFPALISAAFFIVEYTLNKSLPKAE